MFYVDVCVLATIGMNTIIVRNVKRDLQRKGNLTFDDWIQKACEEAEESYRYGKS